jgi:hypothetical protein
LLLAAAAHAEAGADSSRLDGTWVGTTDAGQTVVWQVGSGRLRIDGRPADLEIRSDTLVVRFDPSPGHRGEARETAVYRYLASNGHQVPARLFVFGFDLGKTGIHLVRETPEPTPPEDTSPSSPGHSGLTEPNEPLSPEPRGGGGNDAARERSVAPRGPETGPRKF